MSDVAIERTTTNPKTGECAERVAAQQRSGTSVKRFCKDRGLAEYSFYASRKRLREKGPVRFGSLWWKDEGHVRSCRQGPLWSWG
jgi:hypothetical protein